MANLSKIKLPNVATPYDIYDAAAERVANKVTTLDNSDTNYPSTSAVTAAIEALPKPMRFKGTLGTGGTITSLPTASSANTGYTYKVITAGTYAGQAAKVGDTFISTGSAWVLIPSGDEPSGTVTNVAATGGTGISVSGSPITTSGTLTIENTAPNIQSDWTATTAASGQILNKPEVIDNLTSTSSTDILSAKQGKELKTLVDGKLDKNTAITAATKTKITYDADGLVTAGADLEVTDIPDLAASKITSGNFSVDRLPVTTTISAAPTDTEIPTAKAVKDAIGSSGGGTVTNITFTAGDGLSVSPTTPITTSGTVKYSLNAHSHGVNITSEDASATTNVLTSVNAAGEAPTLGKPLPCSRLTSWYGGELSELDYADTTVPNITSVGTLPSLTYTTTTITGVSSVGTLPTKGADTTVLTGATVTATPTETTPGSGVYNIVIGMTPSTTVVNSITDVGTLPTLGTAINAADVSGWDAGSLPALGTAINVSKINSFSNGVQPSIGYVDVEVPNVTSVGSMPTFNTGAVASATHTHVVNGSTGDFPV